MVLTRKFSEFPGGTLDVAVGLKSGANTQGPTGGGGGGAITVIIIQNNSFSIGQWVRFDQSGNLYETAIATTPENAEVIGVVIQATPTQFTLQQAGYVTIAQAVFPVLIPGEPYFLSDTILGAMTNSDVIIDGEVSRPVFIPDKVSGSNSSGWVLPYRGIIIDGGTAMGGGSPPNPTPDIITINQNAHGLNPGNWVRITTPQAGPQVHYILADAMTLANAQVVGVVIQKINDDQFVLQFSAYIATDGTVTAPFQDDAAAALTPSVVYYLSTIPGAITSTDPGGAGNISKPVYISEQTSGTVNVDAGYILPQRPLNLSSTPEPTTLFSQPGNTFAIGDWLYVTGDNTFAPGLATTLAASQVVGVVTSLPTPGTTFFLQSAGFNIGAIINDGAGIPIIPGQICYLSTTFPGRLQTTAPITVGQVTKPLYVQTHTANHSGFILEQRPILITPSGGGGGGGLTLIAVAVSSSFASTVDFTNVLNATYDNYVVQMEGVNPASGGVWLQMQVGTGAGPTFVTGGYMGTSATIQGVTQNIALSGTSAFDLTSNAGASVFVNTNRAPAGGSVYIYNANVTTINSFSVMVVSDISYDCATAATAGSVFRGSVNTIGKAPCTSLRFKWGGGVTTFNDAAIFRLYGYQN